MMNLNEQCLLKYLTNPIGILNQTDENNFNVQKVKSFNNIDEELFFKKDYILLIK